MPNVGVTTPVATSGVVTTPHVTSEVVTRKVVTSGDVDCEIETGKCDGFSTPTVTRKRKFSHKPR